MSQRNSRGQKASARERMRIERERAAKKEKQRRQAYVGLGVVVVLAAAVGVAYGVQHIGSTQGPSSPQWKAALKKPMIAPAHTGGKNGTVVTIGKKSSNHTLKMYEDPRCPVCAAFEQSAGAEVSKGVQQGDYKVQYVGATFIDGDTISKDSNLIGDREGSKNALSALGAALNVSPEAFSSYKTALYSKKYHPDESEDKFKDDSYLLKVADSVPALKGSKEFRSAVTSGKFDRWALEMSRSFTDNKDGVTATPTLVLDGKKLTGSDGQNAPMTAEEFNRAIKDRLK
ncbi:thioredoxin domain-containing protein [Streptomyces sp. NPDC055817]